MEKLRHQTDNTMTKRTIISLQNTTQKTTDRVTRTLLQTRDNSGDPEGSAVTAPQVATVMLI
jgi:hypothetical protein